MLAAIYWAREQVTGSPTNHAVLVILAIRSDVLFKAFPGKRLIQHETELRDVSTVKRALAALERRRLIFRVPVYRPNGSSASNDYYLNVCPCSLDQLQAADHAQQCPGGWLDGAETVDDVLTRVAEREAQLRDGRPARRRPGRPRVPQPRTS